jgi:curli biogenesis system outer membrane secretion channel CsgG
MRFARIFFLASVSALAGSALLEAAEESAAKPRVAVLEFKNKAPQGWGQVGGAAQDILISELVKKGKYTVIDRERLTAILKEKDLSLSGDVDPKTAVKAGKLLGVEYVIVGSVTEFGTVKSGATTGWLGGRLPSVDIGTTRFTAAIDARAISTTTGEIVWAGTARESTTDARVFVAGAGGGAVDEAQADKVIRPVCAQLVAGLEKTKLTTSGLGGSSDASGIAGKIARVDAGEIYVNVGAEAGVQAGQVFQVVRKGKVITDPDTGEVLGADEMKVGQVKVTAVKGPRLSVCSVVSGDGFKAGDILKPM